MNLKYFADALVQATAPTAWKIDADSSIVVARELEHIRAEVLTVLYAELKAFSFLPFDSSIDATDEAWLARKMDMVGEATLGSDYSDTGGTADVKVDEETATYIRVLKAKYMYSFQEARVAAKIGRPLPQWKANAARRSMAQKLDDILLLGDGTATYLGLYGLFKLSGTATYSVPNGIAGVKTWENKTPTEILKDLNGMVTQQVVDTKELLIPSRLILPVSSLEHIVSRPMGDGSDMTVFNKFRANNPHITDIKSSIKLETAGAASTKRYVAYKPVNDVVEAGVPVEFEQLPPTVEGYNIVTRCHGRVGGVRTWQPKGICYGDGI